MAVNADLMRVNADVEVCDCYKCGVNADLMRVNADVRCVIATSVESMLI